MMLTSPAFTDQGVIPSKYTCDSFSPVSPPLYIADVPKEAESLVIIMDDPDVPKALNSSGVFDHWVMFNIPVSTTVIMEGREVGVPGLNSVGSTGYVPPCPPAEYEPSEHRYVFTLYALNTKVGPQKELSKEDILKIIKKHVIAESRLVARYKKILK